MVRIRSMQELLTTNYWKNQQPEKVLHSMFFDKNLFMSLVPAPCSVLNAGGAGGRLEEILRGSSYSVHTFDFNEQCMRWGSTRYKGRSYIVANATELPYQANAFDAVVTLGLLSLLTRKQRITTLREISRVLKPEGLLVISERKHDPQLEMIYEQEARISGENGTLPAYGSDGNIEFFAHHFSETEMHTYLLEARLTPQIITTNHFISTHSGNIYQGLQVYAKK